MAGAPGGLLAARVAYALAAALAVAGCGQDPPELSVDVKTDFVPGVEFATVRTELIASGAATSLTQTATAARTDDFLAGHRVAEFVITPGDYAVRVSLVEAGTSVLIGRETVLTLRESYALTVLVTRSCRDVRCPLPSDTSERTACVGGRCVSPRCIPGAPECGPPPCTSDGTCAASVACGQGRCLEGECFDVAVDSRCALGERCDLALGCVTAAFDAGSSDVDAGGATIDSGSADAGDTGPDAGGTGTDAGPADAGVGSVDAGRDAGADAGRDDAGLCGGAVCSSPDLCCSSTCRMVRVDPSHCGSCSVDCFAIYGARINACHSGMCQCNLSGGPCAAGATCCTDACHDLMASENNCGACGLDCSTRYPNRASRCEGGSCVCGATGALCPASQICCAGTCRDPLTSARNCGTCGNDCTADTRSDSCVGGSCVCAAAGVFCAPLRTCCADGCFNLSTSATHCGNCATVCGAGTSCVGGSCV